MGKAQKPQPAAPAASSSSEIKKFFGVALLFWTAWVVLSFAKANPFNPQVFDIFLPQSLPVPDLATALFYLKNFLIFTALLFVSTSLGRLTLQKLCIQWSSVLESFIFSTVAGFAVMSFTATAMAAAGRFTPEVVRTVSVLLLGSSIFRLVQSAEEKTFFKSAASEIKQFFSWRADSSPLAKFLIAFYLLFALILVFAPDLFYDSWVYHLGTPNGILRSGHFIHISGANSRFPLFWQMIFGVTLAFTDEMAAKILHWSCGVLTLLSFYSLCGRLQIKKSIGLWAAVILISVPMVQMNLWAAAIDVGNILVSFLACYALFVLVELDDGAELQNHFGWVVLLGLSCGLAYGSKYQGGILALCVGALWIFYRLAARRVSLAQIAQQALLWGVVVAFCVAPWLLKNIWDTGNPVFPFLSNFFAKIGLQKTFLSDAQMQTLMSENRRFITHGWTDFWRIPWLFVFKDGNQSSLSYPGPLFLYLLPTSILGWGVFSTERLKSWQKVCLIFLALYFTVSLSSTHLSRYHLGGYGALCFFFGLCLVELRGIVSPWIFRSVVLGLLMALALQFQALAFVMGYSYKPWDVIAGRESREDYRSYSHPGLNPYPSQAGYRWMEKNLPKDSRVLLVGEGKPFDLKLAHDFNDVFGENLIVTWSKTSDVYSAAQKNGTTHLFLNFTEAHRTYDYGFLNFTDEEFVRFEDFWSKHVRLIQALKIPEKFYPPRDWLLIYAVLPESEAQKFPVPEHTIAVLRQMHKK